MKILVQQSHAVLPAAAALEVAALVTLEDDAPMGAGPPAGPRLHAGFCLDRSGSMQETAGVGSLTKLDALKAAVQGALQLLAGHAGVTVTAGAFGSSHASLGRRQLLSGPGVLAGLISDVENLAVCGSTNAHATMGPVSKALAPHDHAARRLILFTDGHFNSGSVASCQEVARRCGQDGIALWVFATGVNYAEAYLRQLTELGAPGSFFCHVSNMTTLQQRFSEELGALLGNGPVGVETTLQCAPGVALKEVLRLVPQQSVVATGGQPVVTDRLDVLDARGQAYLLRVAVDEPKVGLATLVDITVTATQAGVAQRQRAAVTLDVLPAGSAVPAANSHVVHTVYVAQAAQQTLLGNNAAATQLYAAAGQTAMAQQLAALGTAQTGSDAARTARTQMLGATRLVALGTAQAKGGTP